MFKWHFKSFKTYKVRPQGFVCFYGFIVISMASTFWCFLIFSLVLTWNTKNLNRILIYLLKPHFFAVTDSVPQKSLGEEVNELTSSRLLKLEKDNQTLLKTVEELRGAASQDTVAKLAKVSQENQRLNQKVSNTKLRIEVFFWAMG